MSEPSFGTRVAGLLGIAGIYVRNTPIGLWQLLDPYKGLDSDLAAAVCKAEPGLCAQDRDGEIFKWDGSRWMFWADPWEPLRAMRDYEPGGYMADAPFRLVPDPASDLAEAQPPTDLAEAQRLTTAYLVGDRYDPKTGRHVLDMAGDILKAIAEEEL